MKFKDTELGKVPSGWIVKSVEELINEKIIDKPLNGNHGSIHPTQKDFVESGIPFVMASDIESGRINYNTCKYISDETARGLKKGFAKCGDVLITHKASIGRVALVKENEYPFIVLTPQVTYYRINDSSILNNKFLMYYFTWNNFTELFTAWAQGGSTRAYLGITAQQKLPIVIPSISEQNKISDILSSLDKKIELNNEMNKTLEEMAQALFKRWFVDFEFPNEEGKPYKSSGGEMIESEFGIIPKDWRILKLDEISDITMGVSPSSKSYNEDKIGIALLNGASDFVGKLIKSTKFTTEPKKICKKGDMVFGVRATIGNTVFTDKEYALGRGVAAVSPQEIISREFIYFNLNNSMDNLINSASGSVFLNLKKSDITDLKVYFNEEVVKKFHNIAKSLIDKIIENDIESELLKEKRDLLLPKLMNGEIRV